MPSNPTRRRLRVALKGFEHALLEWLRDPMPERKPRPQPKDFGLTASQASTVVRHCEAVARMHGDLSITE